MPRGGGDSGYVCGNSATCTPWIGCLEKRSATVPDKVTIGTAGAVGAVGTVGAPDVLGRVASHALDDIVSKQLTRTRAKILRDFTWTPSLPRLQSRRDRELCRHIKKISQNVNRDLLPGPHGEVEPRRTTRVGLKITIRE